MGVGASEHDPNPEGGELREGDREGGDEGGEVRDRAQVVQDDIRVEAVVPGGGGVDVQDDVHCQPRG